MDGGASVRDRGEELATVTAATMKAFSNTPCSNPLDSGLIHPPDRDAEGGPRTSSRHVPRAAE
jgi:hypothetical protein